MDENNQVENPVVPTATPEETPAPSQTPDPIAVEVQKIETKKRPKAEVLKYNIERLQKELEEENAKNGVVEDDSVPVTRAELKSFLAEKTQESALELAQGLVDENERKLTIHHLQNTIRSTGDAEKDFALALSLTNAVKNGQLAQESARAVRPRTVASAPSAPPKEKSNEELTSDEQKMMGPPFNLSKEQILAARPK